MIDQIYYVNILLTISKKPSTIHALQQPLWSLFLVVEKSLGAALPSSSIPAACVMSDLKSMWAKAKLRSPGLKTKGSELQEKTCQI